MTRQNVSRREFVRAAGAAAVATPLITGGFAGSAPSPKGKAETAVKAFHASLTEKQREQICFSFDHKLRSRINANWAITKPTIGSDFYTKEQRELLDKVVRGITSEDGYERFQEQMIEDDGGVENYHVAMFGDPAKGEFEWELTGRHLTLRADGDSVDKTAFGGPLVYGHGRGNPKSNLFHYQTKAANKVLEALDGKQREAALIAKAPRESMVPIQGAKGKFPGIAAGDLSDDQKKLVEEVLRVILAPYRSEDVDEAMSFVKAGGGLDALHLAYYKQGDLGADEVWDIWRVEGPNFVCHFRGAPHVHAYLNVGTKG